MRIIHWVSSKLAWLSWGAAIAMMLFICANVLLRIVYKSIPGTVEVVGILAVILISLAIAHTQTQRGHVAIDLVVSRLSTRVRNIIYCINWFVSFVFFSVVTWQLVVYCLYLWHRGLTSTIFEIPYFPVVAVAGLGFAVFSLVLLGDLIKTIGDLRK